MEGGREMVRKTENRTGRWKGSGNELLCEKMQANKKSRKWRPRGTCKKNNDPPITGRRRISRE